MRLCMWGSQVDRGARRELAGGAPGRGGVHNARSCTAWGTGAFRVASARTAPHATHVMPQPWAHPSSPAGTLTCVAYCTLSLAPLTMGSGRTEVALVKSSLRVRLGTLARRHANASSAVSSASSTPAPLGGKRKGGIG